MSHNCNRLVPVLWQREHQATLEQVKHAGRALSSLCSFRPLHNFTPYNLYNCTPDPGAWRGAPRRRPLLCHGCCAFPCRPELLTGPMSAQMMHVWRIYSGPSSACGMPSSGSSPGCGSNRPRMPTCEAAVHDDQQCTCVLQTGWTCSCTAATGLPPLRSCLLHLPWLQAFIAIECTLNQNQCRCTHNTINDTTIPAEACSSSSDDQWPAGMCL
jgi:hypothetical protein